MNKNANPLDYIIRCCEQGLVPSTFDILNAKDELRRLRLEKSDETFFGPIAWGLVNDRGDLHDLRVVLNPYISKDKIVPLFTNKRY